MAVAVLIEVPGLTTETYDAVNEQSGMASDPPAGLIIHTCGEMEGGLRIFDVWETQEDLDRFESGRLVPAMNEVSAQSGASPMASSRREVYHLHNFLGS
jgi:hypothetical protein